LITIAFASMVASCSGRPEPAPAPEPVPEPASPTVCPSPAKIFSETKYVVETKGRLFGSTIKEKRVIRTGAGFLVNVEGGALLVTAAHVASGPVYPGEIVEGKSKTKIDGDRVRVTASTFRVRVGDLSFPPSRILVDREADIALLSLNDEALGLLSLGSFDLGGVPPVAGDAVAVWGFPGTTVPQLGNGLLVAAVEKLYFALNRPLDVGYSGGPVVGTSDRLLGVILRSSDKQTRCAPVAPVMALAAKFAQASVAYSDDMPVR
jgi:hypothetical protein